MSKGRVCRGNAVAGLLLIWLSAHPAQAQTTVNPKALDQLAPPPPSEPPPATTAHTPAKRVLRRTDRRSTAPHASKSANGGLPNPHAELPGSVPPAHSPPKPVTPTIPAAPPPVPVLPPPIVVPTRPVPPPPPVPVTADAPGEAITQKDGLRVTFGNGRSDLNPTTDAALRSLAHTGPPFAATTFTVTAYAAGNPDDPSTPRRLSLARALAARSVLIAEGIPSTRIYVKALGASVPPGNLPADRVDIIAATPPPAAQQPAQAPPP